LNLAADTLEPVSAETVWYPGDVVAFWGRHWKSRVIEAATCGPSHVGIIVNYGNQPMLVESTTLCDLPCAVRGLTVQGVQAHLVGDRIRNYDGYVRRVPIADCWRLSAEESAAMTAILCRHWIGRPYYTGGAIISGTRLLKWTRFIPYSDLGSLFCSQLVGAILMRFGRCPLDNAIRYNPASLIRRLRECGTFCKPEAIRGQARSIAF